MLSNHSASLLPPSYVQNLFDLQESLRNGMSHIEFRLNPAGIEGVQPWVPMAYSCEWSYWFQWDSLGKSGKQDFARYFRALHLVWSFSPVQSRGQSAIVLIWYSFTPMFWCKQPCEGQDRVKSNLSQQLFVCD